ncbi:hypothetical protein [Paraburkholderia diazotrophica]|uniref:Uncharacterized protein n=1 Tax=Paraburkholderia diazotrophica TaxID=667676 RepID=A0A1H6WPF2_9BURK|nr:hypothetical protein [Paraburkholderia diazotrophica]SEJ16077.1 hypothetical protein SAMN05192539_1007110 [Paraburkholderia diazotrophica]
MNAGRCLLSGMTAGLITLLMASAAHAEKYVEIWNPPEARGHSAPAPKHLRPHTQTAPRLARKITEPGGQHPDQGASSVVSSKKAPNRSIPRKISPDGSVFRV